MTFGKNLQRLREAAGLSQSGLANASGESVRSIQNWEIDRNLPRIDAAARIARALGVTVDELIGTAAGPGQTVGPPKAAPAAAPAPAKKGRRKKGVE